jgi:metal-sulfur cluster biosynthetic enzyme
MEGSVSFKMVVTSSECTVCPIIYTDVRHLTMGIHSEKCVVRGFRHANVIECHS